MADRELMEADAEHLEFWFAHEWRHWLYDIREMLRVDAVIDERMATRFRQIMRQRSAAGYKAAVARRFRAHLKAA